MRITWKATVYTVLTTNVFAFALDAQAAEFNQWDADPCDNFTTAIAGAADNGDPTATAIGANANANNASVSIGVSSISNNNAIAIGNSATANNIGVAVGPDAIGNDATASHQNSTAIRTGAATTTDNQIVLGKVTDGTSPAPSINAPTLATAATLAATDKFVFVDTDGTLKSVDQAGAIGTTALTDDSITTAKIVGGQVLTADLADDSVKFGKILDGTIQRTDQANGAVSNAEIAANAVTTAKINDLAVTTGNIQNAAVTTVKLADQAVTTSKITASAVTTGKIAAGAVNTTQIANNAITGAKIADIAIGFRNLSQEMQSRIQGVEDDIDDNTAGTSMAIAMSNIPATLAAGKCYNLGVGFGHFKGESSLSAGITAQMNDNFQGRASIAGNDRGVGFGLGVALQW